MRCSLEMGTDIEYKIGNQDILGMILHLCYYDKKHLES